MFLPSYYVWNCLPINLLSMYLPYYIRYNEFWNFPESTVGQMPYLSVNEYKWICSWQYWNSAPKHARRRAEMEWAQSFQHVHHSQEVSLHDIGYCHGVWADSYLCQFFITFMAERPLVFNGKLFICCDWILPRINGNNYKIHPGALEKGGNQDPHSSF